jgi:hypothetical protein
MFPLESKTMNTSKPIFFLLLFAGIFLIAFFGSQISRSIGQSDSLAGHFLLPGYSLGLIMISASMFLRLTSQVRDLESKVRQLENKDS